MKPFNPLFFIALGLFGVYTLEFGVVGILPVIIERYSVSAAEAGWLVGLFALVIALFGPLMVLLFSRYNRKRILTLSLFIFAGASALSAYAPNYGSLALLRILPAFFHPVYFSLAFVAVVSLYPREQATQATARAFVGTSMGMVLGVPVTTWIAARFSYEAAFLFCSVVNVIAGLGIIARLPDTFAGQKAPYGKQLAILRKPTLWLNILASTLIFAAMFSVYAYSAEYLSREAGMSGEVISGMLILFGVGGVAGNLLAGRLLARHKVATTLLHPLLLGASYLLLHVFASPAILPMLVIVVLWGATHTSGLIVTQVWLTAEAPEAPEFVTGLYIAFINLGVTLGASSGGWFLTRMGLPGTLVSGLLFCTLAVAAIAARVWLYGTRQTVAAAEARAAPR